MTRKRLITWLRWMTVAVVLAICARYFPPGMRFAPLQLIPIALFMPVFSGTGYYCGMCSPLFDVARNFQIVTSGIADSYCTGCTGYNNTYVVTLQSIIGSPPPESSTDCSWTESITPPPTTCATYTPVVSYVVQIDVGSATKKLTFTIGQICDGLTGSMLWRTTYGTDKDCGAFSNESLPFLPFIGTGSQKCGTHTPCDGSASTCLVTTL